MHLLQVSPVFLLVWWKSNFDLLTMSPAHHNHYAVERESHSDNGECYKCVSITINEQDTQV